MIRWLVGILKTLLERDAVQRARDRNEARWFTINGPGW